MRNRRLIYYSLIGLLLTAFASCSQEDWEQESLGAISESSNSTRTEYIAYTIHVETAGTLGYLVEAGNYSDAQKLTVTGNISYDDVHYVDVNMPSVEILDLSGATYSTESIPSSFLSSSSKIKEISLPNGVTSIERGAFSGCSSLTSVKIPDCVTEIGAFAFYECSSLTSVTLPNGLASIQGLVLLTVSL